MLGKVWPVWLVPDGPSRTLHELVDHSEAHVVVIDPDGNHVSTLALGCGSLNPDSPSL